jgi:hypothetical protein
LLLQRTPSTVASPAPAARDRFTRPRRGTLLRLGGSVGIACVVVGAVLMDAAFGNAGDPSLERTGQRPAHIDLSDLARHTSKGRLARAGIAARSSRAEPIERGTTR